MFSVFPLIPSWEGLRHDCVKTIIIHLTGIVEMVAKPRGEGCWDDLTLTGD